MNCDKKTMLLYAVTDRAWVGKQNLYEQVESALKGGVTCVQLREKELDEEEFLKEAMELSALCRKYGVPFFVNDNVEIAIKCHADGIHVGQEDMEAAKVRQKVGDDMMIGVSVHSVEEALEAVRNGADCLGVGAMFSTSTKTDVDVLTKETLRDICAAVEIPVVAIGGIGKLRGVDFLGDFCSDPRPAEKIGGLWDLKAWYEAQLSTLQGQVCEVFMHPCLPDGELLSRSPQWQKRVWEYEYLKSGDLILAAREAGFRVVSWREAFM